MFLEVVPLTHQKDPQPRMPVLDRERLTNYPRIILVLYLVIYGFFIVSGTGSTDRMGKPIGGDFSAFWASSHVLLTREAADVYDDGIMFAAEKSIAGVDYRNPIFYPPTFFFFVAPLALVPYFPSLILWVASTFAVFQYATYRFAPHALTIWLTLAFPGTFQNVIHGHNGFVTASILGLAFLVIEKRPFTAGLVLGLLSFKPHLAMLIPLFLLAGRAWRTLVSCPRNYFTKLPTDSLAGIFSSRANTNNVIARRASRAVTIHDQELLSFQGVLNGRSPRRLRLLAMTTRL